MCKQLTIYDLFLCFLIFYAFLGDIFLTKATPLNNTESVILSNPNEVLAEVGPEKITRRDYIFYQSIKEKEQVLLKPKLPPQKADFELETLNELIVDTLIFIVALQEGISYSEEQFQKVYQEGIVALGGPEVYQQWLNKLGVDDSYVKEKIKQKLLKENYLDKLKQQILVTDEEVRSEYQRYIELGIARRKSRTYDFSNILIIDYTRDPQKEKQIFEIYERIQKGEDFIQLAQRYSEDAFSTKQGCMYREVTPADVIPEIGQQLLLLPEGAISQPFRSHHGWNIIKVISRNEVGIIPYEKLEKGLRLELQKTKLRELIDKKLNEIKKDIPIKYLKSIPKAN